MPQVGIALAAYGAAFAATPIGGFLTTNIVGRLLVSVAASALLGLVAAPGKPRTPGIKTEATASGGVNPVSFPIGRYATAGYAASPAMSHGKVSKTPNAYLTYVIGISDIPGVALENLIIDNEQVTIGTSLLSPFGLPVLGRFADHAWIKYYDGSQATADPMLLDKYATYPERPWLADMVGSGQAYAILTFRYNRQIYNNLPEVRFTVGGIPLYDPRLDSSVGGSGTQRWDNMTTWAASNNPALQVYNILRGIAIPGGHIWGGRGAAADLPLATWFAAMNECDVDLGSGGSDPEPQFRSGYEVQTDEEPASVIEELLKGCAGQLAEMGGAWKIHVGAPALPIYFFSDDDIVSRAQELDPFPGGEAVFNAVQASYPEPAALWKSKDAPLFTDAAWEAEDGGRRVASLALPAVPYGGQVQRLQAAYGKQERRFLRHVLTLPPDAAILEPLTTVAWTSARNGYDAKLFEVFEIADDQATCLQQVSLRERDPSDHAVVPGSGLPIFVPSPIIVVPPAQALPDWVVTGISIPDGTGAARRTALHLTWDGAEQDDVRAVEWQVRLSSSGVVVASGSTHSVEAAEVIVFDGILPATDYQARGRFIADRATDWSLWADATTPDVRLTTADVDFSLGITTTFEEQGLFAIRDVTTLPASSTRIGEKVFNRADGRLYEWMGSAWVLVFGGAAATDITGALTSAQIADAAITTSKLGVADFSKLFSAQFVSADELSEWVNTNGAGETAIITDPLAMGGKALQVGNNLGNDMFWAISTRKLTFDPNKLYKITSNIRREAGAGTVYLGWAGYLADGVTLCNALGSPSAVSQHYHAADAASPGTEYTPYTGYSKGYGVSVGTGITGTEAVPGVFHPNVKYIAPLILVNYSGVAGITVVDRFEVEEMLSSALIQNGLITSAKIAAKTITGDNILSGTITTALLAVGAVRASNMVIDENLSIDAASAGFQMGKLSAADLENEGIYMGRTAEVGGGTGFGFLAGKTIGGVRRYLQATTADGLRIVNAKHRIDNFTPSAPVALTTSQTYTITPGTVSVTIQLIGGGGGGASSSFDTVNGGCLTIGIAPGTAGTSTTVALYDGATPTGQTWTSAGAAGGSGAGTSTTNPSLWSPYGNGGAGGAGASWTQGQRDNQHCVVGGSRGAAASLITATEIDVSGLTAPKLVVTVGAAGVGGTGGYNAGANGGAGRVEVGEVVAGLVPAGVIPELATFTGSFAKAASATGNLVFPDLGHGLWVIWETAGNTLNIGSLTVDSVGTSMHLVNPRTASFVANIRPNITVGNSTARTIKYMFYRID